jgi:murein DD-endopeptidase MepM/ murein hydrolase activator NlpD
MTKKTASGSGRTPLSLFYRSPRLMLGLSLLSGFSILSSGLVIAQTDSSVDTGAAPLSTNVEAVPKPAPEPPAQRKQVVTTIVVPVTPAPRANREHEAPAPPPAPVAAKKPVAPSRTSETATRKPASSQRTSETATRKPASSRRTSETASRKPASSQRTSETASRKPASSQRTSETASRKPATLQRSAAALGPAISISNKPILSAPDLSVSDSETIAKPPKVYLNPAQSQESAKAPDSPTNLAIDRTDSSSDATRKDDEPAPVILTDRSTGCRTVSRNGQLVSGICDIVIPTQEIATPRTVAREIAKTQAVNQDSANRPTASQPTDNSRVAVRESHSPRVAAQASRLGKITIAEPRLDRVILQDSQVVEATSRDAQLAGATTQEPQLISVKRLPTMSVASTQPVKHNNSARSRLRGNSRPRQRAYTAYSPQLQPVAALPTSSLPISEGWTSPTGLAYYNVTARPEGRPNTSNANFIFPLASPSAISSLFGWRIHPITGDYRFHAGTDISAPEGTPVLAAVSGQVITADFMGGYGLTVVVQHEDGNNVSLYAHLSEIFVQPGDLVEQGNALGRVGSTGFSTGPHLHFEWRHMTPDGWVALDARPNIEYALAQFVKSLEVAQASPQPASQQPASQQSVPQQPASQAPISQLPTSQSPALQQPVSQPPTLQQPVWQQSVSQQPVSQRGL